MKDAPSTKPVKEVQLLSLCIVPVASYIFLPILCTFCATKTNFSLDEAPSKGQK